jgi:hypothetical protein
MMPSGSCANQEYLPVDGQRMSILECEAVDRIGCFFVLTLICKWDAAVFATVSCTYLLSDIILPVHEFPTVENNMLCKNVLFIKEPGISMIPDITKRSIADMPTCYEIVSEFPASAACFASILLRLHQ